MKILVLGRGLLGQQFETLGHTVVGREAFDYEPFMENNLFYAYNIFDSYDAIVNCIAKSDTRWCEDPKNLDEAIWVNGRLPGILSTITRAYGKKFVHISTGCLYDSQNFNREDDPLVARCNYTMSKWIGEQKCHPDKDLIIRPRLLFSHIDAKNNLLSKLPKYDSYVCNYFDSLTCTHTLVHAIVALLEANQSGVFNVANEGYATMSSIAHWCGIPNIECTTMEGVRAEQGLYLVNALMSIDKLKKFYTPEPLETAIKRCYNTLHAPSKG